MSVFSTVLFVHINFVTTLSLQQVLACSKWWPLNIFCNSFFRHPYMLSNVMLLRGILRSQWRSQCKYLHTGMCLVFKNNYSVNISVEQQEGGGNLAFVLFLFLFILFPFLFLLLSLLLFLSPPRFLTPVNLRERQL